MILVAGSLQAPVDANPGRANHHPQPPLPVSLSSSLPVEVAVVGGDFSQCEPSFYAPTASIVLVRPQVC